MSHTRRIAIAFQSTAENGTMGLFHRYETSMRRSWDRALDRLEAMCATQQSRARDEQADSPREQADAPHKQADSPNEPSPTNEH
jgi:hypothetical protein